MALRAWVRALERTAPIERQPERTLPVVIAELAARHGDAAALTSPGETLSYRGLHESANGYAHWALERGLGTGDVVCLLMENCPRYLAIWLGLTRIGVTAALINTNLGGELLAHSINTVAPRYVISSARFAAVVAAIGALLPPECECWAAGPGEHSLPRVDLAAAHAARPLETGSFRAPTLATRALCIYTSGTTGLPKAANVSHHRLMQWSHWFAGMMDVTSADRMYDCLPLYHSVGGVVATGATLVGGGTVVLRERFSASSFWEDVSAERCTLFQYIGELCRYLLGSAPQAAEARHALRLACGNGLRAEVWEPFQTRFRVPHILEYYAATEGNFSLYNCEGRPGAIGRIPPFLAHRQPVALVQFDPETAQPRRDAAGRCLRCAPGEAGEALGQILPEHGSSNFEGYTDATASQGKVLRDVFVEGDAWYRTGDLLRQDAQGFFFFVDRLGDTFRWKGENVSTTEVAAVIGGCAGVEDVAVYGVRLPHSDGRAGMAAIVTGPRFEPAALRKHLAAHLPAYARPLFLRLLPALELTGTFKLRKQQLIEAGYDPERGAGPVYVDDPALQAYVPLDAQRCAQLEAGTLRV